MAAVRFIPSTAEHSIHRHALKAARQTCPLKLSRTDRSRGLSRTADQMPQPQTGFDQRLARAVSGAADSRRETVTTAEAAWCSNIRFDGTPSGVTLGCRRYCRTPERLRNHRRTPKTLIAESAQSQSQRTDFADFDENQQQCHNKAGELDLFQLRF